MRQISSTPSVVPGEDFTVYLVFDDWGPKISQAYRESEPDQSDKSTIIHDLIAGEYSNPVKVVAFNDVEGWAADVSEDVAREAADAALAAGNVLPQSTVQFFERHTGEDVPRQLVRG